MKKILFLIVPLFFLLFLAKPSFAQTSLKPFNQFFGTDNASTNFIADNTKDTTFVLMPFTKIIIQANTFSEKNIKFLYFGGKWDEIKNKLLPKDQSPITSYFFFFTNSQGKEIRPSKPLKIETFNNFIGTKTYYYPLNAAANIDEANKNMLPGPILAKVELPINDYAFIIGVNKILNKNDPLFTAYKNIVSPSTIPSPPSSKNQMTNIPVLYKIIAVALIIVILAIAGFLYSSKRKPKKIRKIEEPSKIIVGGK